MRAWTATGGLAGRLAGRLGADLEEELDMPVLTANRVPTRSVS